MAVVLIDRSLSGFVLPTVVGVVSVSWSPPKRRMNSDGIHQVFCLLILQRRPRPRVVLKV